MASFYGENDAGGTMDIAAELKRYRDALREQGSDPASLEIQAQALVFLPDTEFEAALKSFDLAANDPAFYGTSCDCDFGALLLEFLADACGDGRHKRRLYRGAKARAETFASYASSGGEGLARCGEVERIACKTEALENQTS